MLYKFNLGHYFKYYIKQWTSKGAFFCTIVIVENKSKFSTIGLES